MTIMKIYRRTIRTLQDFSFIRREIFNNTIRKYKYNLIFKVRHCKYKTLSFNVTL